MSTHLFPAGYMTFFFFLWLYRHSSNFIATTRKLCLVLMPCDAIWPFIFHDVKILSLFGASLWELVSSATGASQKQL